MLGRHTPSFGGQGRGLEVAEPRPLEVVVVEDVSARHLQRGFDVARRPGLDPEDQELAWFDGAIPERAAGELYCHTLTDRSILGDELTASGARTLTHFGLRSRAAWKERVDETCQR